MERPLEPEVEQALFRVVQESLNNVLKHARAHSVTVELNAGGEEVRCAVRDDGAGFLPDEVEEGEESGCGLASMRERMRRLGGELRVESAPGAGTGVIATVPRRGDSGRRGQHVRPDPRAAG
jgi:signal transduction histidine kinase